MDGKGSDDPFRLNLLGLVSAHLFSGAKLIAVRFRGLPKKLIISEVTGKKPYKIQQGKLEDLSLRHVGGFRYKVVFHHPFLSSNLNKHVIQQAFQFLDVSGTRCHRVITRELQ